MKKIFEIPEITKLSLVTEKVTLEVGDFVVGEGSQNPGDLGMELD